MPDNMYFRKIFETISSPVVILSPDAPEFTIVFANNAYVKFAGLSSSKLTGKSIFEFLPRFPGESHQAALDKLHQSLSTALRPDRDESGRDQRVSVSPQKLLSNTDTGYNIARIFNEEDKTLAFVLTFEKCTGQPGESLEMNLLLHAPAFVCILKGPEHRFRMANEEYEKIAGKKDLIGKTVREVLPELEGQGYLEMLDKVYLTGESFTGNEILVKLDRQGFGILTDFYVNFSYQAYRNNRNEIEGIFVLGTDVSYQVESRKAVQESEKRYRLVIEQAMEAIWTTDSKFHFTDVNPYACDLFGYSKKEFLELSLADLMETQAAHGAASDKDFFDVGETKRTERRFKNKNGGILIMEIGKKRMDDGGYTLFGHDISERIQSGETDRFKAELLNAIGEAVLSTDLNGVINFWNKAAEKIYGWKSDEAVGKNIKELLVTEQKASEADEIMKILEAGKTWSGEFMVKDKSGRYFSIFVNTAPRYADNGSISGIISISYDNTQHKMEIEELKHATNRMLLATKTAGMGIWDWDIPGNGLIWDKDMHRIYHNNMIQEGDPKDIWISVLHPDDQYRVVEELQHALSAKEDYTSEYRIVHPDSSLHYIRASGMIEKDENGNAIHMIGVNWDITAQKLKEQQLVLMESVITNTSDSVLITEAESAKKGDRQILYVNKAFTNMTGYEREDVIGKSPKILQGPKSDRYELDKLKEALKSWQPFETTLINYKKTGEEFWINFSLTPVADKTGWFTHWIAIERDVTQRKNEELEKMLLVEVSVLFNASLPLKQTLGNVLERVASFGGFSMAEVWLVSADQKNIHLVSYLTLTKSMTDFYKETILFKKLKNGEGLAGITWQNKKIGIWQISDKETNFIRREPAVKAGLQTLYGVPLIYNDEIIGVFVLGMNRKEKITGHLAPFLESLGRQTGIETRRKQLEQELDQIFRSAPDIICIIGSDGYFKKINPAACDLLGYSEFELMAVPIIQFVHAEDRETTLRIFNSLKKGNPSFNLENRCIGKSGKAKWLAWTASYSPDEAVLFAVAKDITEKKELENLLKKANSLARFGSWEIDPENSVLYWSDVTREIHEAEHDFIPNIETAVSFYKEGKDRDLITEHITKTFQTGQAFDTELQIVTAKGNEKWIRVIGDAEFSDEKMIRVFGSFQDIDRRKRDELAFNRALEEKNIILESIGDGFIAVDKAWKVTYWNNQAEALLHITKTEILGKDLWSALEKHIRPHMYARYLKEIMADRTVHFETYLPSIYKWFSISAYPTDQGLSVYFRDITENKISEISLVNLHADIQKHAKDLAISNAELEQFAYVASHDLQEPLRMITSYLTQIEKKYGEAFDEKGKQYMFFAVDGAKRMRQIILDLLEYSRVGRSKDKTELVDLNEIIKEIRILFRKRIEEKNAVIFSENLPQIRSVTSPIRQVFQNLIGNALKYTRDDNPVEIHVGCIETEKHWQFAIKDNGIGIAKEYHEKIFIIFQRLHTREEFSGTGLGLAITKKIIENLGGSIWVDSDEGAGSVFYFTLLKNKE